jgi:hypothetical protein
LNGRADDRGDPRRFEKVASNMMRKRLIYKQVISRDK